MYRFLSGVRGGFRLLNIIRFIELSIGNHDRIVTLRDGSMLKLDLRSGTEWPVRYSGAYDDLIIEAVTKTAHSSDSHILDIGANVGLYSARLARNCPDRKIFSFEPVPSNHMRLNENLALNGLTNVQTFNVALSDKAGELDIVLREDFKTGGGTGNASVAIGSEADDGFERLTISSRTLDSFVEVFKDINIGVIKIDIEGHEDMCFIGAKKSLTKWRPYIFSEVNAWYFERRGVLPGVVFRESLPDGYMIYKIIERESFGLESLEFDDLQFLEGMHNVVFCPREKSKEFLSIFKD